MGENSPIGVESAKAAGAYSIAICSTLGSEYFVKADKIFMIFGLLTDANLVQGLPEDIYNDNKRIQVDTEKFQSSTPGIFAVGDCNDYPGKLKLILSGFHETTLAVQEAYRRIHKSDPEFMYTTTSTALQEKLKHD